MASTSNHKREKGRLKRETTRLTRALQTEHINTYKLFSTLMMVLAQKGGEVTVTKGTAEQVFGSMNRLSYVVEQSANENEFVIRQVTKEDSHVDTIVDTHENIGYHDTTAVVDPTPEQERVPEPLSPHRYGGSE
jgi:hypothetical protein